MEFNRVLSETATRLAALSRAGKWSPADLKRSAPWLCRQIARDAQCETLFGLWGQSINHDEHAGVTIVEPGILRVIGEVAGIPMEGPIVHAGLQHTYGYLLSTIETPYGYKRDRWVSPEIELGLGLRPDTLGPDPSHGTLLANATWTAGRIAFRGHDGASRRLRRISNTVADDAKMLEFQRLPQIRIVETVKHRDRRGRFRSVRLQTDLVRFPNPVPNCKDSSLLVYSVADSLQPTVQLITLFGVSEKFAQELTRSERLGAEVAIQTRFNAFVEGVSGRESVGRRTLEHLA